MNMNKVGKFEGLHIVNEFDKALIELYGVNMTDARITRYEVLSSYDETGCPRKSAQSFGLRKGFSPVTKAA